MKTANDAVKRFSNKWPMKSSGSIYANHDDHIFLPVPDGVEIHDEDRFYFVCDNVGFEEASKCL